MKRHSAALINAGMSHEDYRNNFFYYIRDKTVTRVHGTSRFHAFFNSELLGSQKEKKRSRFLIEKQMHAVTPVQYFLLIVSLRLCEASSVILLLITF